MSVFITGAAGFLGRAVVDTLEAAGQPVDCHAGPLGSPGPERWYRGLIDDVAAVGRWTKGADVIVHLAGPPWVGRSFQDPAAYARAHTVGTAAVLSAAIATGAHVVYISSAEVYGRPEQRLIDETCPLLPVSPYGAAKLGAEAIARALAADVGVTILRPFCVYGDGGHEASVSGRIITQLRESTGPVEGARLIEIMDGAPVRDFVHVCDVARAVRLAVEQRPVGAFNVGTGRGTSIASLATMAAHVAGFDARLEVTTATPDHSRVVASTVRCADHLGWRAEISIEEGIRGCVQRGH